MIEFDSEREFHEWRQAFSGIDPGQFYEDMLRGSPLGGMGHADAARQAQYQANRPHPTEVDQRTIRLNVLQVCWMAKEGGWRMERHAMAGFGVQFTFVRGTARVPGRWGIHAQQALLYACDAIWKDVLRHQVPINA